MFNIRGDGLIHSLEGGILVSSDGLTVSDGGVYTNSKSSSLPSLHVSHASTSYTGSAIFVDVPNTSSGPSYNMMLLQSGGTELL